MKNTNKKSLFAWKGDAKTLLFLLNVKQYAKNQTASSHQRSRLA